MTPLPQQMPSAVIFDMDGTIVQHIDQRILNVVEWVDDRIFNVSTACSRLFRRDAQGQPLLDEEYYETRRKPLLLGHRAIHKLRRKHVNQIVQPSPNVHDVLKTLKDNDIPVGLASNGLGKGYGIDVLDAFNLTDYFGATVFREDIRKSKPNPESLLMTLRRLDVDLNEGDIVWYIGDRRKDVKAAMKANESVDFTIVPVAYTDDAAIQIPKEHLSDDHVIQSYADLNALLLSLISEPLPVTSAPDFDLQP